MAESATVAQLRECNRLSLIRDNTRELNRLMKDYDNNLKVTGVNHLPKNYYDTKDPMHAK